MKPLRRWVPASARALSGTAVQPVRGPASDRPDTLRPNALRRDLITAKDMAFCAEFAVHGGQSRSPSGFQGEAELVRLHRTGLLDLERDTAPPYNIVAVSLSAGAHEMLSGTGRVSLAPQSQQRPADAVTTNRTHRRNGFEVARAMVGAAVKAEVAAWTGQGSPGGPGALEQRLMARITELRTPFEP